MLTKRPRRSMPKVRSGCTTCKLVPKSMGRLNRKLTQQNPEGEVRRTATKMSQMCLYRPFLSRLFRTTSANDYNRNIQPSLQDTRESYGPRIVTFLPLSCSRKYIKAIRHDNVVRTHYAAKPASRSNSKHGGDFELFVQKLPTGGFNLNGNIQ